LKVVYLYSGDMLVAKGSRQRSDALLQWVYSDLNAHEWSRSHFGYLERRHLFSLWMSDRERRLHDWRRRRTVLVFFVLVFLSVLSSRLIKRLAERYSWDFFLDYHVDILLFVVSLLASVAIETVRYKASQADTQSGS
jgi:hypothetical protein